ncbi:MAG: hypothetical protein HN712_16940 [Gemmatimonadetes bacterium]|nr:hypothetical protein [Gemmatimonadota bacterium]MBT7862004.1 hypothetical protein [Gemmatimonadota bacterium]
MIFQSCRLPEQVTPADNTGLPYRLRRLSGRGTAWVGLFAVLTSFSIAEAAQPVFENRTPTGFSITDSLVRTDFVEATDITVRVDLNQAATPSYPVIGHFHNLERATALHTDAIDGLRADLAVGDGGTVHMAWISSVVEGSVSTPVYHVNYARSNDNGLNFTSPVSVSGSLRFDLLTADGPGTSFSTLDLEIDSRGNPRVVYAFDASPDGRTATFNARPDNIYLNYSPNGGASWLPANSAIQVNDSTDVEGRSSAFPQMAIDERDNIYISYVRGVSALADDIMLARVDRSTSPFTMETVGGADGGVRLTVNTSRQTGPDLAIGTGDVLHVLYFEDNVVPANSQIEHKTLLADDWNDVSGLGWDQDVAGAAVDGFDPSPGGNPALNTNARYLFPTALVDTISTPDRIYAFYKFGDATLESVAYNYYDYDHAKAGGGNWNAAQASTVWSTAASPIFSSGDLETNIELEWELVDRVSAVLDDRRPDTGEIHIAFSAGYSNTTLGTPGEQDIYYGYFNGNSWTLPERVADDDAGTIDGVAATDVFLQSPILAKRPGDENIYMAFVGGTAEGYGVDNTFDADQHAYFKVLGRSVASEDQSHPVGGYQYDLTYTPILAHDATTDIEDNVVYVHVADHIDGSGLGATGRQGDGFLAGDWENVGTSLQDNDKYFEGQVNEDASSDHEWGDDDDKVGLLVKLNILGSDSSTNLQLITSSTASDAGTGQGTRTIRVGNAPPVSLAINDFFMLGAEIDIIDANRAPTIAITQPDGSLDSANTSYTIRYDLTDVDDDFTSGLQASLYFAESGALSSVSDVRIFGTLIADENDDSGVNSSGTDDFLEGKSESYTWDEPPAALRSLLFASIYQVRDGDYYIYLVADDGKNPPSFTVSPGVVTIRHKPLVQFVDPIGIDTVDTGVRTGSHANPYDFDFLIRDFDGQGSTQVALFYSAVNGLTSVSVSGTYPNQNFALGKSISGTRGVFIEGSQDLTSADVEFSWDVTDSVFVAGDSAAVEEGHYYLYAIASDGEDVAVGQGDGQLALKHSPTLTFYEPPKDTHRRINSGSQSVYTLQWQKGPGDADFDDDATIDLYFTTDSPLTVNYEGYPDSLRSDVDTRVIESGLSEDGDDGASDMYVWDFRSVVNDIPIAGRQVWVYALIRDTRGNENVELGGSITVDHSPRIVLLSSDLDDLASFEQNDVLRLTWDDYLVDDGSGTDDAHIRVYASTQPSGFFTTLSSLEADVGSGATFLVNSSDGTLAGHIPIREDSTDFYDWNTRLFGPAGAYLAYAAISPDGTFGDNNNATFDVSTSALTISGTATPPNVGLSPTDAAVAIGDTLTLDVMVQHSSNLNLIQIVLDLNGSDFSVVDQGDPGVVPFIDLDNVFAGSTPIENRVVGNQLRFAKSSFTGELVGSTTEPAALARVQLVARETLTGAPSVSFSNFDTGTVFGLVGQGEPLDFNDGLTLTDADLTRLRRGVITATVELEGHTAPLGSGDHSSLLDIHLRIPGSTIDIDDAKFIAANDADLATADTVEVSTDAAGALTLFSIPAGRYVLTVKDSSHVSGRTDTIVIRNGETIDIVSSVSGALEALGFLGSDLRGDPTFVLPSTGSQLIAGDVSEDNEINEDDVNLIIAAWGTNAALPSFEQADINNDDIVGASDLTVTTSNFGNSEGFGAPPVYKPTNRLSNDEAVLDLQVIGGPPTTTLRPGDVLGIEVSAHGLGQLAGYEFDLGFDAGLLQPLTQRTERGDIFDANPHGSVFQTRVDGDRLRVIGSRVGKDWAATGEGRLLRLWFEVQQESPHLADGLELGDGVLLDPGYAPQAISWQSSVSDLLLPRETTLQQNYPNPFNPTTVLPFSLKRDQDVRLEIYNVLGQRIRTLVEGPMSAGFHTLVWNGRDDVGRHVGAGLYFTLLETESIRHTRKMSLLK